MEERKSYQVGYGVSEARVVSHGDTTPDDVQASLPIADRESRPFSFECADLSFVLQKPTSLALQSQA